MSTDKQNNKHCEGNDFKRLRYFHGMLLEDKDFKAEQIYHIEKRKLLNRSLHGWGVVCGLGIDLNVEQTKVIVQPGFALDCHGNEIVVCEPVHIPIASISCLCPKPTVKNPMTEKDCKEMLTEDEERTCYIGIRFCEIKDDPVPVHTPSGGCEEKSCDYSRTREGFFIDFFDEEHIPYQPGQAPDDNSLAKLIYECRSTEYTETCIEEKVTEFFGNGFCGSTPDCPVCCPEEHFVLLGTIELSDNEYSVSPNQDRRYVISFPFIKQLFRKFFDGVEEILKSEVDDLANIELPEIRRLFENPIDILCWAYETFLLPELAKPLGVDYDRNSGEIKDLDDKTINDYFKKKGFENVGTVRLSKKNKRRLYKRSYSVKNLDKDDAVEVVVDETSKKPLFYIPAREGAQVKTFKKELEKSLKVIDELKTEVEKLKGEKKPKTETKKSAAKKGDGQP